LGQAGQSWQLVDLDIEGYEPDHGTVEAFVEHAVLRRHQPHQGPRLLKALIPILRIAGKTLPGAAFVGTLLGLAKPIGEIVNLVEAVCEGTQHALPGLPERERLALLLDRLFELLSDEGSVAVLVRQPHRFPDPLKRLLLQVADRRPSVALAFMALPEESVAKVTGSKPARVLHVRLTPLKPNDVRMVLARGFPGHSLPSDLPDALWNLSKGSPRDLAARVGALVQMGCLAPDEHGVWRLPDEDLDATPLVRIFSYPFYDPIDRLIRTTEPVDRRAAIERFLAGAVICGENVPADVIFAALNFDQGQRDWVSDFVDDHLVSPDNVVPSLPVGDEESPHWPVFQDLQYRHPGLPNIAVYAFTNPLFRHAIRDRLPIGGWSSIAHSLLLALDRVLPPVTRAAAEIHLSVASFLEDDTAKEAHLRSLAWWVGARDGEALTELLVEQLRLRELDPELLWASIIHSAPLLPAHRTLALLGAYEKQADGVPTTHLAEFHDRMTQVMLNLGMYREAVPHATSLLQILEAAHGEEHPSVAVAASHLARALRLLGDHVHAKPLYERVLRTFEAALGPTHPAFASALDNLGIVLGHLGDHVGARAAHHQALQVFENAFGPEHPDVASTLNNLSSALDNLGRYPEAKEAIERALRIREKVFGPEHPAVAIALDNLGTVLHHMGDHADAKVAHERALLAIEKAFGPEHPDVAVALHNLQVVLEELGDHTGAKAAAERALRIREKVLGPAHPDIAIDLLGLSKLLHSLGDDVGAKAAHARALQIYGRVITSGQGRAPTAIAADDAAATLTPKQGVTHS
jgi:tetratricopeptide (TPR) repeat protein